MIRLDIENSEKDLEIKGVEVPNAKIESLVFSIGYTRKDIEYGKIEISNCESGLEELDKTLNKISKVDIEGLNFFSCYLEKMNQEEKQKYNAIVKYENLNKDIKTINELLDIVFDMDCYLYVESAKDIEELTKELAGRNKQKVQEKLEETMKIFQKRHRGIFETYNNKKGYVELERGEEIKKRSEIQEYKVRGLDGSLYKFKSNIMKALGLTINLSGTLYKKDELLFFARLNYKDLMERLEYLTGRKPIESFDLKISSMFGITNTYVDDKEIIDMKLIPNKEEEEEFE